MQLFMNLRCCVKNSVNRDQTRQLLTILFWFDPQNVIDVQCMCITHMSSLTDALMHILGIHAVPYTEILISTPVLATQGWPWSDRKELHLRFNTQARTNHPLVRLCLFELQSFRELVLQLGS